MRTGKKGTGWSQLWKRNAVVAAIALFVCAAVYLNWNYEQEAQAGKTLGQSTMVGGETEDPLLSNGSGTADVGGTASDTGTASASSDYFATARLNRQQARDSALSLLQDAAAREDADETVKEQVNETIQTMADYTVTEAQIENLVVAKGYTDCVAFIGENSLSLAVSAPEGGLVEADTAKIVDVVNQAAGFTADQIKIIEVE
ncbi:SpoIIIAH-like protein [uncultured Flavonifractor sp.]|uniref:SpoIIIAH-like family protein n=1 Tax=Flintibacter hominis TaxID=2763048 RepID=A0A8J6J380_9FIRM|nr:MULTISPECIES: SpoIIIAH-like family protein [Eubacteriales]SCH11020.1 SpoIIIAH-like protein [uncultured Clostridium sp.]SCI50398.1 SpoIIIAH-like protein [uncultured Flavonifractor sp.]MBC5723469.1 SpoIIIAH-like family protein [Flintibacter hominis]MCH1979534.1 SpoIIIAH-like family protein [Lawsonibacter sp. OA9]MCU6704013.1 SpoIIIAH-like family protein [Muriventricola aceti]